MGWRCGGHGLVRVALLGVALGLAGCLPGLGEIGAPSPPTRFYTLSAAAPAGEGVPDVGIGLSQVRLPGYLDRAQIVTRPGPNELALAEFDRWGEPLGEAVARVVAENLSRQLGVDRVQRYPWRDAQAVTVPVAIDVLRLEGPLAGPVSVEALWQIRLRGTTVEGVTRAEEEVHGGGYDAYAAALSRGVSKLSEDVAAAIRARAAGPR